MNERPRKGPTKKRQCEDGIQAREDGDCKPCEDLAHGTRQVRSAMYLFSPSLVVGRYWYGYGLFYVSTYSTVHTTGALVALAEFSKSS